MPLYINYIIIVIAGLAVGSFLNVLVLRFDQFETIFISRSRCPHCKKNIRWYDLIPFFSFVFLGAKCRDCKKPISIQYPIVEVLTSVIFATIYWKFGLSAQALLLAIISSLLIAIAAYDIISQEVPDVLSYSALVLSIGFVLLTLYLGRELTWVNLASYAYAVLFGGGFLAVLVIISREKWMGAGDIALGAILGLLAGWPSVLMGVFLAFISGSVVGLILLGLKKKNMKDAIAFGPFLVLGTFIAIFWGEKILSWYFGIF